MALLRDFVARKPDVFVNLFNNVYSTNFAQWIEGSWPLRVRLWVPEPSQLTEESLIGDSWEAALRLLGRRVQRTAGRFAAGCRRSDDHETTGRRGTCRSAHRQRRSVPRTARHRLWSQPLRRRNAVATMGTGRDARHGDRPLARRL